jgi:hypothetical protein
LSVLLHGTAAMSVLELPPHAATSTRAVMNENKCRARMPVILARSFEPKMNE